jgi:hypothetical protein
MKPTKEEILDQTRLNHNLRTNDLLEVQFNRADHSVIIKAMDLYAEQLTRQKDERIAELETALEDSKDTLYWVKEKYFERNYGQPKLYATYNQVVLSINRIEKVIKQ